MLVVFYSTLRCKTFQRCYLPHLHVCYFITLHSYLSVPDSCLFCLKAMVSRQIGLKRAQVPCELQGYVSFFLHLPRGSGIYLFLPLLGSPAAIWRSTTFHPPIKGRLETRLLPIRCLTVLLGKGMESYSRQGEARREPLLRPIHCSSVPPVDNIRWLVQYQFHIHLGYTTTLCSITS